MAVAWTHAETRMSADETDIVGDGQGKEELGEFCWCLSCERASATALWAHFDWACPLCHEGTVDVCSWERVRKVNASYPQKPRSGVIYPIYW